MRPGESIAGRFEIEGDARSGGMGTVYRARDRQTNLPVGVKVLRVREERDVVRFNREAELLADLKHPGIVRYVAHGVTDKGAPYLAMEWLDGEDLAQRLTRQGLSPAESVSLARSVAEAMAVAHARGVIHRDLKPGNLFLPGGRVELVKVLDFGLARATDAAREMTVTGSIIGTAGYMAPEQARGDANIDTRVDVFALGCVLFECLTGRAAFEGAHAVALLSKIVLEDVARIRTIRPDLPAQLDAIVHRMTAKERDARPRDFLAVAAELAALGDLVGPRTTRGSAPPVALTSSEQRLFSVVVAAPARASVQPEQVEGAPDLATRLRAISRAHAGRLERLADGSVVISLLGRGGAVEQAGRSARCALALRELLPRWRIVLATGSGIVDTRTPIGEVIDRAAVVLERAVGGTIALDEATAALLDARFDVTGTAPRMELHGLRDVNSATRTLLGRTTTCVGRDRELRTLAQIYAEVVSEPIARVALLTGPAGAGKSRVLHEFVRTLESAENAPVVLFARGDSLGAGSPFGLIAPAIRRAAGIVEGEPLEVRREKLRQRVSRSVSAASVTRIVEFVGQIAGVAFPAESSELLRASRRDPIVMGDQMRAAWLEWLAAECAVAPVLIVIEDLHWGDLPTIMFLDAALRNLKSARLMIVAAARPEVHEQFPRLWSEREPQEIRLVGLTRKASERLAREVLGPDAASETIARVVDRADGNAFYLEELLRSVATGAGAAMPDTVLAMAQARLDGLPPESRRLLRAASTFGQCFWLGGVAALTRDERGRSRAIELIDDLAKHEVIVARGTRTFAGEAEYAFAHALVREAAYAMLTDADRTLGHRLAGAWLEQAGESDAMILADHYERGGVPERAVRWYRLAAEQALQGNDLDAVLTRAERVVRHVAAGEDFAAARLAQAEVHNWRGEFAHAERCALEAMAALEPGCTAWLRAAAECARASGALGHRDRLESVAVQLRGLETRPELEASTAIACARIAVAALWVGRYELAEPLLATASGIDARLGDLDPAVRANVQRAMANHAVYVKGDPATQLRLTAASVDNFARAGDVRNTCRQRVNTGYALSEMGLFQEAEAALQSALETAEAAGLHQVASVARNNLGYALARRGDFAGAIAVETKAVEEFVAHGDRRMEAGSRVYLAFFHTMAGDLVAAEAEARRSIEVAAVSPPTRTQSFAALARALLGQARTDEALAAARDSMQLLESLGNIDEGESGVRLTFAECLYASGDRPAAIAAITRARERVEERAAVITDPLWQKCFREVVPENARILSLAREWLGPD